jgi:hypothetical protein
LSISVRLRNFIRGDLGPIWAVSANEEEEEEEYDNIFQQVRAPAYVRGKGASGQACASYFSVKITQPIGISCIKKAGCYEHDNEHSGHKIGGESY